MKKTLIALSIFLISAAPAAVYVQSHRANVMNEPSFSATKAFEASKGEKLRVLEEAGKWLRVGLGKRKGWIPALLVGPEPPLEKVTVFTGSEKDISRESRRRASAATSAAAARGLAEDDRRRLGHHGTVDYRALEKMESLVITDDELAGFLRRGD